MEELKTPKREAPSDKFRDAVKQILSVPKSELLRREIAYRNARKNKNRKRHR